jgi:hypothetical protein
MNKNVAGTEVSFPDPGFHLHEPLSGKQFEKGQPVPTVTILPIFADRIAMVRPKGDPNRVVMPQGEIKEGETPVTAMLRVLHQKLGMQPEEVSTGRMSALLKFTNKIPAGRPDGGTVKDHYVVAVKLSAKPYVAPNKEKVTGLVFVANPGNLDAVLTPIAEERPVKHDGTVRAIHAARAKRFLLWEPSTATVQ